MTESLPTWDEILEDIQDDIVAINPDICDFTEHSMQRIIHEPISKQFEKLYILLHSRVEGLLPATATGDDLSSLVLDRLPSGRLPGYKAAGKIAFYRMVPQALAISIPAGTICSAPAEDVSGSVQFITTEAGTILANEISCEVEAEGFFDGEEYNVRARAINQIVNRIDGVDYCENQLAFAGGTDEESDEDLLDRYITSIRETGKATSVMIEDHLQALSDIVRESKTFTMGMGDVEIVVDCSATIDQDIYDSIEDNLAAGVTGRGILAGRAKNGANEYDLDDCVGGYVWVRPVVNIGSQDSVTLTYTNLSDVSKEITVTIPAGTKRGAAIKAVMDGTDKAKDISAVTYTGSNDYDILIGLGTYPYMFNRPTIVPIDVEITIVETDTPELDLDDNIQASVEDLLNDFKIGDDLEWSDIFACVICDYTTGRRFDGIDKVVSISATDGVTTIDELEETLTIDNDERVEAGDVNITIS